MAKKSSPKKNDLVEDVIDAEEIKEPEESVEEAEDAVAEAVEPLEEEAATEAEAEVVEEATKVDTSEAPASEAPAKEVIAPEPSPTPPSEPPRQPSTFMPMLLGGLVAGGLGFGAGYYLYNQSNQDIPGQVEALQSQLEELAAQSQVDLNPINDAISGLEGNVEQVQSNLAAAIAELAARVDTVERQPNGDGTLSESAASAYESDIQALRDQLTAQQSEMQAMLDATSQQLEETQKEAAAIEEQTVAAAKAATARSALARIQTALDAGAPFGAVLAELEAVVDEPIPDALTQAQDGVPTLAVLSAEFPEAARAALTMARVEGASGEETTGFSAFLRNQFSVRSVVPQEGGSVDAILSRAQGALDEGRLNDALAEVASVPEVARVELSDWVARAELRADAVDAASSLFTTYNSN